MRERINRKVYLEVHVYFVTQHYTYILYIYSTDLGSPSLNVDGPSSTS